MKILFIAPNPHRHKTVEGYLQRVLAIDQLLDGHDRHYYDDFPRPEALAQCMIDADIIYVHSIYRAEEIIENYKEFSKKIVTDLHGIVPEEEECLGRSERSERLQQVESEVFTRCHRFVAVTEAMVRHFHKKYPVSKKAEWIVLPIFEDISADHDTAVKSEGVVYAGGAQRWQNVDDMISLIKKVGSTTKFYILTQDVGAFSDISELDSVTINTVERSKVPEYYKKSALGFMLRDDIEVNRVACPTKLIEYLAYGVVPIVKSPGIGDFSELGYQYISTEDLLEANYTPDSIENKAKANFEVYKSLKIKTVEGKQKLTELINKMTVKASLKKDTRDNDLLVQYIIRGNRLSQDQIQITALNNQVKEQIRIIDEYARTVKSLQSELKGWGVRLRSLAKQYVKHFLHKESTNKR